MSQGAVFSDILLSTSRAPPSLLHASPRPVARRCFQDHPSVLHPAEQHHDRYFGCYCVHDVSCVAAVAAAVAAGGYCVVAVAAGYLKANLSYLLTGRYGHYTKTTGRYSGRYGHYNKNNSCYNGRYGL